MDRITRAFEAVVSDVNRAERSIVATINTSDIDHFNSVIDPAGGKLDSYRKNPVVLSEHGKDPRRHFDPIGNNAWIKPDGGRRPTKLIAKTRFLEDDYANQRYEWYRDGVMTGFSVRPLPDWTRCGMATKDEIRANPELGRGIYSENGTRAPGVMMFRAWSLAEYSAVTLTGNANCVTTERAAQLLACTEHGLWFSDEDLAVLRGLSHSIETEPAVAALLVVRTGPYVIQVGSGPLSWHVIADDNATVARYDTEAPAVRCLAVLTGDPGPRYAERVTADALHIRAWGDQQAARAVEAITLKLTGHCGSR
jgi:hypothetical protein